MIKTDWRVVWRSPNKRKLDLALIYAPVSTARCFTLIGAGDLVAGQAVASAGWSGFIGGTPMASHAAGRVVRVSEQHGEFPGHFGGSSAMIRLCIPAIVAVHWSIAKGRLIGIHSLIRVRRGRLLFGASSMSGLGYVGDAVAPTPPG